MPRGVPANGRRQPRAVAAPHTEAEMPVAGSTMDFEERVHPPVTEEAPEDVPVVMTEQFPDLVEPISPGPPVEEVALTPEQEEIKRLRDQLAQLSGRKDVEPEYEEIPTDGETIRIHFLEDGLTVNGRVMYRGEELEFVVGGQAYKDTFNRNGWSWLELRNSEFDQVERYGGKVMFRNGPWPGKTYADGSFETLRQEKGDGFLRPPTADELDAAEKARKKRAAPRLPQQV